MSYLIKAARIYDEEFSDGFLSQSGERRIRNLARQWANESGMAVEECAYKLYSFCGDW